MYVKDSNSAGMDKKHHYRQTVIIAEVVVGKFCYRSALAYYHFLHILMTGVDPVGFVQILQYFAQSVFTRGRTFLIYGHVIFFI